MCDTSMMKVASLSCKPAYRKAHDIIWDELASMIEKLSIVYLKIDKIDLSTWQILPWASS